MSSEPKLKSFDPNPDSRTCSRRGGAVCADRECIADSDRPYGSSSSMFVTTGFTVDQRHWVFQNHHGECTLKQSQVSVRKIPSRKCPALHVMIVACVATGMRELLMMAVADVRWDQRAFPAAVLAALTRVCISESTYELRLIAILHHCLFLFERCLHQGFLDYMTLAEHLLDHAEDAGFDLHLYPQGHALALQRSG